MRRISLLFQFGLLFWCAATPSWAEEARARVKVSVTAAALEIHAQAPVFDGHNDLPWALRSLPDPEEQSFDLRKPNRLHTNIPKLRQGGVGAQFWSAYVPADTRLRGESLRQTLEQIERVHALTRRYPDVFEMAKTADDIERIRKQGKIASMIGIEGGHSIENSIGVLRKLYDLGARYMTLTHSDTLDWADSATDAAKHGGLTPFGEEVVREMNRLGMLVDLSHVSPDSMKDALRVSKAPIIFSHSSAYEVARHPRNVPDDVLRLTAKNGGVVMVNFFSGFVVPSAANRMASGEQVSRRLKAQFAEDQQAYRTAWAKWKRQHPLEPGSVHDVVDHIDHIVHTAGIDHVGLGSDFDGVSTLPEQLQDVSTYPMITQELLNRGYAPAQIRKILGQNIMRVLRAAENAAQQLRE